VLVCDYNYKVRNIVAVCTSFTMVAKLIAIKSIQNPTNKYSRQILNIIVN